MNLANIQNGAVAVAIAREQRDCVRAFTLGISVDELQRRQAQASRRQVEWAQVLNETSFNSGEYAGETVMQYLTRILS